ncbi:hypothetical protein [Rhodococcus sp. NPDC076796]|uniref:hypothetical protein n=1 Tax=Rhodococcus sp. NPDC076796 TaxID=3154859 RepID=UPI00344F0954
MTARTAERTQFLSSLLSCAIESGLDKWAEVHEYRCGGLDTTTGPTATIHETVSDWSNMAARGRGSGRGTVARYEVGHELDIDIVARGIRLIASGRVKYTNPEYPADRDTEAVRGHARLRCQNSSNGADCEFGGYDAADADAIVQAGLFDELKYR